MQGVCIDLIHHSISAELMVSLYTIGCLFICLICLRRWRQRTAFDENHLLQIPSEVVAGLAEGVNFVNAVDKDGNNISLIMNKSIGKPLVIIKNQCAHQGGTFMKCRSGKGSSIDDIEDTNVVTCTRHGWKLDTRTLQYIKPSNFTCQESLDYVNAKDGSMKIFEIPPVAPWDKGLKQERKELREGEMTVTFLNHASVEIKGGDATIISDPWFTGPAFCRGWWLLFKTPEDAYQRAARASAIWLSHSHSDHLNLPTLKRIAKINRDVPIFVADLDVPILGPEFYEMGFSNVNIVPLETWIPIGSQGARFMILRDGLIPYLDTFMLFEYKGHKVVNVVDCARPNNDELPRDIDVLLSDFASGASGFPALFTELHGEEKVKRLADIKARQFVKKIVNHVRISNPKVWIPFAGYFTEAAPGDEQVRLLNRKNSPQRAYSMLKGTFPGLKAWFPFPGGSYDLARGAGDVPERPMSAYLEDSWDFKTFLEPLRKNLEHPAFQSVESVIAYYKWAGFNGYDLILHIIETDDLYKEILREYIIDFGKDEPVFLQSLPSNRPLLRIRARASVLWDVYIHGKSWDNIYIGFSGRYHADPDIYHFKFLDHFANCLPKRPPVLG